MRFILTTKNCQFDDLSYRYLMTHTNKIMKKLSSEIDPVIFRVVVKKNLDLYHPQKVRRHKKTYADWKPELAKYDGTMTFRINKHSFYAHVKGKTIDELLKLGLDRIIREVDKYRNLHFKEESDYPNHQSIRRDFSENYL